MLEEKAHLTKDLKFAVISAIVSALILLPILANIMGSPFSATSTFNNVALINEDTTSNNNSDEISILTQFQSGHDFRRISPAGVQTDETSDFVVGQQSLKLSTDGNGSPVFTRRTSISPSIDLTDKTLGIWLKVSSVNNIQELRITVTGDKFQTLRNYWLFTSDGKISTSLNDNKWTFLTIDPENIRDFGNPDLSNIDTIQLRVVDKGQGPVSVWFNGLSSIDATSQKFK